MQKIVSAALKAKAIGRKAKVIIIGLEAPGGQGLHGVENYITAFCYSQFYCFYCFITF